MKRKAEKTKSKYFVINLVPPGRVDYYKRGIIRLHEAPDSLLLTLYKEGESPFIQLTPEGRKKYFSDEHKIEVENIELNANFKDIVISELKKPDLLKWKKHFNLETENDNVSTLKKALIEKQSVLVS